MSTESLKKACPGFRELSIIRPWLADWLSISKPLSWPYYGAKFQNWTNPFEGLCRTIWHVSQSRTWVCFCSVVSSLYIILRTAGPTHPRARTRASSPATTTNCSFGERALYPPGAVISNLTSEIGCWFVRIKQIFYKQHCNFIIV